MAFQTCPQESSGMPLLEELRGETVLSLAQRSPKHLSDLCRVRGLATNGTVHELAVRLLDWKKVVGHGPAPATPRLHDEFEPEAAPELAQSAVWEDEESRVGLEHLTLVSPAPVVPFDFGLAKNSELTTPSSTPATSYHSAFALADSQVEETLDFTKFKTHPKPAASPRRTPPANQPPALNPPLPGGPNLKPLPDPVSHIEIDLGLDTATTYPAHQLSDHMNQLSGYANRPTNQPPSYAFQPTGHYQNQSPGLANPPGDYVHYPPIPQAGCAQQNQPANQARSPPVPPEPTSEVLFQSLLGGLPREANLPPAQARARTEPASVFSDPALSEPDNLINVAGSSRGERAGAPTAGSATPEPKNYDPIELKRCDPAQPKHYDPTKPLAKGQLEEFLLRGPGRDLVQIKFTDLVFGRKLGSGGYKECYAGTYKGDPVAIGELKVVEFTPADFQEIKNEIDVLKQLWHENVVRFIGVTKGPSKLSLVTELCHQGDLYDHMRRAAKPPLQRQLGLMHDIALGVAYLHTRRPSIIHRDLKSMNILLNDAYKAKINDFGLARIRTRVKSLAHTQCGTPNWQAPEVWAKRPSYTEKVDVYAVGLIFWEILQWGAEPYPYWDIPEPDLVAVVGGRRRRPSLTNLSNYPRELITLVVRMWDHDPAKRPSMGVVIEELVQYLD
ncbi:hypothetical protein L0F63_002217 [Massospora cicadina]|nr:hypothetical protein L0F63_002217 [Massospora cicadina]